MDLSTTKKIKRRVLTINADPNAEITEANITVANWFQNQNLESTKFKISSFYLQNTSIPCFIPKYISSLPNASFFKDKNPSWNVVFVPGSPVISPTSLGYWVAITDATTTYVKFINMVDAYSEHVNSKPPVHPSGASEHYKNKYYWFYNTSKFAEMVAQQIEDLIFGVSSANKQVEMIRTTAGDSASFGMYVDKTAVDPGTLDYTISFSPSLIELFQFKNVESAISTNLRDIVFNVQTRTYDSIVSRFVASNYIGDQWFPWDEIVFKSDMPIESVVYYDNANYIKQNYQNIILAFRLINTNPDAIYNFFYSEINPESSWVSMINNNSGENATFNILLRLKITGDLIPYTIKKGEYATFETEEIVSY